MALKNSEGCRRNTSMHIHRTEVETTMSCSSQAGSIKSAAGIALPLHFQLSSVIALSKLKSKGRYISFSLNIIKIEACTCNNFEKKKIKVPSITLNITKGHNSIN